MNPRLPGLVELIVEARRGGDDRAVLDMLIGTKRAVTDFNAGTTRLRLAGAIGTCTSGAPSGLLTSWLRCARRKIAEAVP